MKYLVRRYGPPQRVTVPRPWMVYRVIDGWGMQSVGGTFKTWREAFDFAFFTAQKWNNE